MNKSKADQWADELMAAHEAMKKATSRGEEFKYRIGDRVHAWIDSDGDLRCDFSMLRREDALALGRWIVDMYSPQPDAAPAPVAEPAPAMPPVGTVWLRNGKADFRMGLGGLEWVSETGWDRTNKDNDEANLYSLGRGPYTTIPPALVLEWVAEDKFRITHQDDERIARGRFRWKASNGVRVESAVYPEQVTINLFIRGDREKDIVTIESTPRADIDEAVLELNTMLAMGKIDKTGKTVG